MGPQERLWLAIGRYFTDEEDSVGLDVGLGNLASTDLDILWRRLSSGAAPIDPSRTAWDQLHDVEVPLLELLALGVETAAARCSSLLVPLEGVTVDDVRLPYLGFFLYSDEITFHWWSDGGWSPVTVAALADLVGELIALAPGAVQTAEHAGFGEDFWRAVNEYLAAVRRRDSPGRDR